jgi:hypothetical protein
LNKKREITSLKKSGKKEEKEPKKMNVEIILFI